jgi:multiple antibiotic resistance protein
VLPSVDLHALLLTFIPLFVAIDVVGLLPMFLGITSGLDANERRYVTTEATFTAAAIGVAFLFVGDAVLTVLGVSVGDFQVAGGILLLVLAVYDLIHPDLPLRQPGAGFGVMPLGTPMIVGPAVMTTLLALARTHGYATTLIAFALNLLVVWTTLHWGSSIGRFIGDAGARAAAKVANVLLAAIAVAFIRRGIVAALADRG